MKRYYMFMGLLVIVAVVATIVQSQMSKGVKADQNLSQKISDLGNTVQDYALSHRALPLANQVSVPSGVTYTVTDRASYKICGTFLTENINSNPNTNLNTADMGVDATYHGKGYQCFNGSVTLPDITSPAPTPSKHPIIIRPTPLSTPQGTNGTGQGAGA